MAGGGGGVRCVASINIVYNGWRVRCLALINFTMAGDCSVQL